MCSRPFVVVFAWDNGGEFGSIAVNFCCFFKFLSRPKLHCRREGNSPGNQRVLVFVMETRTTKSAPYMGCHGDLAAIKTVSDKTKTTMHTITSIPLVLSFREISSPAAPSLLACFAHFCLEI